MRRPPPRPTLFPYTTLFRSRRIVQQADDLASDRRAVAPWNENAATLDEKLARVPVWRGDNRLSATDCVRDRKSTRLNSSHITISYAVFCLKKKKYNKHQKTT